MTDSTTARLHKIATFLINNRYGIVALFLAITIGMMFAMSNLRIETGFKKQLPLKHEYMQTFLQYEKEFGGANRVLVALVARDGDMFTPEFFEAFEAISDQVFFIPGVDRASVRSIFTPNVRFVEIVEDGFAGGNVIPSDYAPSPEMFERVRSNIVKSGEVGRLVSADFSGAMVWANLMEENPQTGEKLDYRDVAAQLEAIRTERNPALPVFAICLADRAAVDLLTGCRNLANGYPEPAGLQSRPDEYSDAVPDFRHRSQPWCAENQRMGRGKGIWRPDSG